MKRKRGYTEARRMFPHSEVRERFKRHGRISYGQKPATYKEYEGGIEMVYTLEEIKEKITPIAEKYQIPVFYIFGSYARGTADENSDLDFLVDTAGTALKSLFLLGALYHDLETAFEKPIDLITVASLEQEAQMPSENEFKKTVWEERVSIYHAA